MTAAKIQDISSGSLKVLFFGISKTQENQAIGIFPEGGSHDRTDLLPLKAGIFDSLRGNAKVWKTIPVVPVGINLSGHRFRSRVFVEMGKPIVPSQDILNEFVNGG